LRESIKKIFLEQASEFSKTVGLFYYNQQKDKQDEVDLKRKSVVLVHGLDDPGEVWQCLAPELIKAKYNVWVMDYPNDQPVVESSLLFVDELKQLRLLGIRYYLPCVP
jgi:pimeloyl-ACP methyl ester carboxylesterase